MRQAGGGSQSGIVKTSSNTNSVTLIGVEGTFNTSNDLLLNGAATGITPSSVSTTYGLADPCLQLQSMGAHSNS